MKSMRRWAVVLTLIGALSLAACGGTPAHTSTAFSEVNATPPPGLSGPALTAWHVLHDVRPARDPIAIATGLRHVAGPIPTVARTAPLNAQMNDETPFYVPGANAPIMAKLVYITPHVYDYVQDGVTVDLSAIKSSADRFETSILVANHRFLGSEWTPGVDDDVHITLLNVTDLPQDAAGLFEPQDEYVTAVYPTSNQREMLYLNVGENGPLPNTDAYDKTVANLFARMIQWHLRPADPAWLRAATALMAQHLNGFDASMADTAFLAAPDTQLNTWDAKPGDPAHFGASFLFLDYIAEHYGGYSILKQILSDPAQAPLNINDALALNGSSDRFDAVFAKWVMANALNDEPQGDNSPYAYKTVTNEHATPQHMVTSLPLHDAGDVAPYAAEYYDAKIASASTDQALHVAVTLPTTVPLLSAAAIPAPATQLWWSNRGDNIDTTLTRTVDLTKVTGQTAALNFSLWYDLENSYDYGYVSVSVDNGATWSPLPVTGSHTDDPNGLNVGNGLTGQSTSDGSWVAATADLSPYVGKTVLLRFETITDDSVNGQGMAVANISIPQIGYTDDGSGWTTRGWLRTDNVLPETPVVQVAVFGADGSFKQVLPVPVGANGMGTLDIPQAGKDVGRVLVAVAALAPATTLPAHYTLDLTLTPTAP